MILKVPLSTDVVLENAGFEKTALTSKLSNFNRKRLAVMLPFRVNRIDFDSIEEEIAHKHGLLEAISKAQSIRPVFVLSQECLGNRMNGLPEVFELICSNAKAKERCGWEPKWSLDDGLAETVAFVRENLAMYRPQEYSV